MNKKFLLIFLFTFLSVALVFFLRLNSFDGSLFMIYTILVTSYLVFIYAYSYSYKPIPDLGFRPTASIIIPVKNEEDAIQNTIIHALNSDYPPDKLDVIVIDDGSTDKTEEKIRELLLNNSQSNRITFIKHEINRGKREAMASGMRVAKGEILISIDSDSYVDKDAVKLLVQPFIDKEITAVCGHGNVSNKYKNLLTQIQHAWYQEMFYILKSMESQLDCVNCCSGILAAYRKENVRAVLDEWLGQNFFGIPIIISDDRQLTNLSLRGIGKLSTREAKVKYQSNAIVYTAAPDNIKQFLKQQIRWRRGSLHGTLFASKFMWKKKFPIPLYFYPYMYLTYITPFVIFRWLVYKPINGEWLGAIAFISGVLYVGFLHGLNIWKNNNESEDIFYRTIFGFMSIFLTAIILPYSVCTLWKNGWITRGNKIKSELS
jgi:hyaluronan synthase